MAPIRCRGSTGKQVMSTNSWLNTSEHVQFWMNYSFKIFIFKICAILYTWIHVIIHNMYCIVWMNLDMSSSLFGLHFSISFHNLIYTVCFANLKTALREVPSRLWCQSPVDPYFSSYIHLFFCPHNRAFDGMQTSCLLSSKKQSTNWKCL